MSQEPEPRVVFGPRDQHGLILGLRAGQIGILVCGVLLALGAITASQANPLAILAVLALAVLTGAAALMPVGGRGVDEWGPVVIRHLLGHPATWRSTQPSRGQRVSAGPTGEPLLIPAQPSFPPMLRHCSVLAVPVPRGELGVVRDTQLGTWTAVLRVRGSSFALLDSSEKARRMAAWGVAQAALAHHGTPVSALQVVIRSTMADPDAIARHVAERHTVDLRSPVLRSYLALVDDAAPVTQAQDVHVAVQLSQARARRAIRQAGGGDQGAAAVLARQLQRLQLQMERADIRVDGALPPRLLAQTLRESWNPATVSQLRLAAPLSRRDPESEGVDPSGAGPLYARRGWRWYETDSALHVSYWISEWPRRPVSLDYLIPLVLQAGATARVSVCMQPVDPVSARRDLETARTQHLADEQLRRRHGFRTSVDVHRQSETVERRESEFADGHAEFRFCGHITVSAESVSELETACGHVEEQARASCLDIRRMDGEHDLGFAATLPLARGIW
jgi:hypothetical protein